MGSVGEQERLYRRIPQAWYQPGKTKKIPQKAFMPRPWVSEDKPGDFDGLSVDRAALTNIDTAATMPQSGKKVHLCEFGMKDVLRLKLTVKSKPWLPNNPAHSVIPELNSLDLRDPAKEVIMQEQAIALRDSAVLVYEAT
jgi:hypothetical protein